MNWLRAVFLLILSTVLLGACGGGSEPAETAAPETKELAARLDSAPAPLQAEEEPAEVQQPAPSRDPAPRSVESEPVPVRKPAPGPAERPQPRRDPRPSPPPPAQESPSAAQDDFPEYEPPQPVRTPRTDQEPVIVPSPPRAPESTPPRDVASDAGRPVTPPAPTRRYTVVVPEGTPIEVRLAERLDSSKNQNGDRFQAILDRDLEVNGQIVAPRGSRVTGALENVDPGGRVKGRAEMTLYLLRIDHGEDSLRIETNPITIQAESSKAKDAKTIGIASGVGAAIGAIAGGKKGAAIGAAIGGGAGAGRVLTSRGEEAVVEREQLLSFRLERQVEATVR